MRVLRILDPSATSSRNFCCDAQRCPLIGFVLDGQFCMRRRNFIALLGGAAAAWPLGARAQQTPEVPRVGFVRSGSKAAVAPRIEAILSGLGVSGYAAPAQ